MIVFSLAFKKQYLLYDYRNKLYLPTMTSALIVFLTIITICITNVFGDVSKIKIDVRIMGGESTTIEEYPYQVSVIYMDTHICGGSIIHPKYILTAAHCTNRIEPEELFVRAGSTIVDQGGQMRPVQQIYQHDKYDEDTYNFDISILTLTKNLDLGSGVAVIALPPQSADIEGDTIATATGWGRLYENGPLPMELQKVDLPTISDDICKMLHPNRLSSTMFCAGYMKGQKDTCQGDSGGPLAANGLLLGITSWGDGCGEPQSPGVYTKVAFFRNYIDNYINNDVFAGVFRPQINVRIVGGETANIEEFPYQVSVIYVDSHFCGGSILNTRFVLTAAHCTDGTQTSDLMVRVGSSTIDSGGQVRKVVNYWQHKKFDSISYDFDIALLKVDRDFIFGAKIAPVQLPLQDDPINDNDNGIATGWGRLSNDGPVPLELQKVLLPTISTNSCRKIYAPSAISDTMFCAGYDEGGKDACDGDSGGPLAVDGKLVGIISWGYVCAAPKEPGVYTKVSYFVDYINSIIDNN